MDSTVRHLQASLFPPQITTTSSYFSNFLVKTHFEDDEDGSKYQFKESSSRDWFPNNKDVAFTLQPPRWPTECQVRQKYFQSLLCKIIIYFQVLEERVKHIPYIPPSFEPFNVVSGNECQPKPSGEECGTAVFQYNPISAVNYVSILLKSN